MNDRAGAPEGLGRCNTSLMLLTQPIPRGVDQPRALVAQEIITVASGRPEAGFGICSGPGLCTGASRHALGCSQLLSSKAWQPDINQGFLVSSWFSGAALQRTWAKRSQKKRREGRKEGRKDGRKEGRKEGGKEAGLD